MLLGKTDKLSAMLPENPGCLGIFSHLFNLFFPVSSTWDVFLTAAIGAHSGLFPSSRKTIGVCESGRDILPGKWEVPRKSTEKGLQPQDNNLHMFTQKASPMTLKPYNIFYQHIFFFEKKIVRLLSFS